MMYPHHIRLLALSEPLAEFVTTRPIGFASRPVGVTKGSTGPASVDRNCQLPRRSAHQLSNDTRGSGRFSPASRSQSGRTVFLGRVQSTPGPIRES